MRAAGIALVALAVVAVALGLWTIGGPEQARSENRDAQRMSDLHAMARHVRCLDDQGLDLTAESPLCPLPEARSDPKTGAPYDISTPQDGIVTICAAFETAQTTRALGFDAETGCLTVALGATD
ncbi:MAG: hypothetical protein JJU09_09135 [Rhodobacteraceae bacterium]|nr:hypothetical protein [Paracoccaceae bacterium]